MTKTTFMNKKQILSALSFFLILQTFVTDAQTVNLTGTVSTQQDYRNVNFSSQEGKLNVTLPGVLNSSGQGTVTLTGTVTAEPSGKTQKEKEKNLKTLEKMVLVIGGTAVPLLAAENKFNFSVPSGSTNPVTANLSDGKNNVEIKLPNPAIPLPPHIGPLSEGEQRLTTDQKVFLNTGNISVYTPNNTSTLFSPTDKFFIKDPSGNKVEAKIRAQSSTQTVLSLPENLAPGEISILRDNGKQTDEVKARVINLSMTTPNAHLVNGENSSVTIRVDNGKNETAMDTALSITCDLANLTPDIIKLAGGNSQVISFPSTSDNSVSPSWAVTRTISGATSGAFNLSANIYPSKDVTNNSAITQEQSLKTPEQFNSWVKAINNHLLNTMNSLKDDNDKVSMSDIMKALPTSHTPEDLEASKIMANAALRNLGTSDLNETLSDGPVFAAYHAATENMEKDKDSGFVHTDVLEKGLNYLNRSFNAVNDQTFNQNISYATNNLHSLVKEYSPSNIVELIKALQVINAATIVNNLFINYDILENHLTLDRTCATCTKQCASADQKCTPGIHTWEVEDKNQSFKDANGHLWRKFRKVKGECYRKICRTITLDSCCSYTIWINIQYTGDERWEEGVPDASGNITYGPPQPSTPCHCGKIYDAMVAANISSVGYAERIEVLKQLLEKFCPGLTLGEFPKMAKDCGLTKAGQSVTKPNGKDIMEWIQEVMEGIYEGMGHH